MPECTAKKTQGGFVAGETYEWVKADRTNRVRVKHPKGSYRDQVCGVRKFHRRFEIEYPEHAKLEHVEEEGRLIIEFLQWLEDTNIGLARYDENDVMVPACIRPKRLMESFFGVDHEELEKEQRRILERQRECNEENRDEV